MQALTIYLPDTAYRAALAFSPAERERLFAVAITTAHAATFDEITETDAERAARFAELEEADIQAVGRGLEALARGETIPGDVFFARMKEQARRGLK